MEFNATFLISAISFILFVIIMNFIFYKPIERIVNERNKLVDNNYDEAKQNDKTSEQLLAEREKKISDANFEGKTILNKKTEEAELVKITTLNEVQKNTQNSIQENEKELSIAFENTKKELNNDISDLAKEMTQKLFGEKVAVNSNDTIEVEKIMQEGQQ